MRNFISLLLIAGILSSCGPLLVITAGGVLATSATIELAKKRSVGRMVDDIFIEKKIKAAFFKKGYREFYTQIDVTVNKGKVLYTGIVREPEYIITAIEIAWKQEGVTEVINEMKMSGKSKKYDTLQYVKDAWITGQIKAKIIFNKSIKFVNSTVITINNVVYIFGSAISQENLDQLLNIAATVSGVKEVVNYVIVLPPKPVARKKNYKDYQNYSTHSNEPSIEESLDQDSSNTDQKTEDFDSELDSLLK